MNNIRIINQGDADKKLQEFIKNLSTIEVNFSPLPKHIEKIFKESGFTLTLYTICFLKGILKMPDAEIIKELYLTKKLFNYLDGLIKEEIKGIEEVAGTYLELLYQINKNLTDQEIYPYLMSFFCQGRDFIKENYCPKDFEDIVDIDPADMVEVEEIDLEQLEKTFNKSINKVNKCIKKQNENINKWNNSKTTDAVAMKSIANSSIDIADELIDQFDFTQKTINLLMDEIEIKNILIENFLAFLQQEDLILTFNKFIDNQARKIQEFPKKKTSKRKTKPKKINNPKNIDTASQNEDDKE